MSEKRPQQAVKTLKSLFIPCATVFISSFCIMVLELVAGRIIARFLGSSLYTWTSVIGVVLAGITVGNYLGGRLADRFRPRRLLAILFAICAAACLVTIVSNNIVGNCTWLWRLNWPSRILLHVTAVFLLPSALLGTISPVVAKMALEKGLPTGRTVGDIYAWGAAGSIAGTFATGYYLIALMGTISIIWAVAGVMIVMALFYGAGLWSVRTTAAIFLAACLLGTGPWGWARQAALKIGLKEKSSDAVIYEDETNYCYVAVKSMGGRPEARTFVQDKLVHSKIVVGEPNDLQYPYGQIMAAITHRFADSKDNLSFMVIGGGGYALPGYLERYWPGGTVDVVEIDPGVTKAAFAAFELDPHTEINTIQLDARNYVDGLIEKKRRGLQTREYDFIYEDAINSYSVPYQLTTIEFNEKIHELLADDGIYMVNIIDVFNSGLFLGSMIKTLEQTFDFVAVLSRFDIQPYDRNTYVIVAAQKQFDLTDITKGFEIDSTIWHLSENEISRLVEKSGCVILTDDYAPVENMLTPVVLQDNLGFRAERLAEEAQKYLSQGNMRMAIRKLESLIDTDPAMAAKSYGVAAFALAKEGKINQAFELFDVALEQFAIRKYKEALPSVHYNYAMLLKVTGRQQQAEKQFDAALQMCSEIIAENPRSIEAYLASSNIYAQKGDLKKAAEQLRNAVEMRPDKIENHLSLMQLLYANGDFSSAIQTAQNAAEYFKSRRRPDDAEAIMKYLGELQSQ